ncbi:type II toxin-antitoxin system VapC family toxin [soil metagenome]
MAYYLDTSALVKLVVAEHESAVLEDWLHTGVAPVSSDLSRTELVRAVRRVAPDRVQDARAVLDGLILMAITTSTFEAAGRLTPDSLRSIDAIHLAVAMSLGDDLEGVVTYDERFATAARLQGVHVTAPSS